MVDSRLRGEWLGSPRFDDLSDTAWRMFTLALMWCNEQGTDGDIPARYVRRLHADGPQDAACAELTAAGLWTPTEDGYTFERWAGELGQSTADDVAGRKRRARERSAEYRARLAATRGAA